MAAQISIRHFILLAVFSVALMGAGPPPQRAETVSEENAVYAQPSFDAKVIAVLPPGKIYSISNNHYGTAFYKIRVKNNLVGYIADTDVRPFGKKAKDKKLSPKEQKEAAKKEEKQAEEESARRKKRPFEFSRYLGGSFYQIKFEEDTMGSSRSENVTFFGIKMSGADVLIEGLLPTEINILYAPKPPGYYETMTRQSASGFIFITDLLLQNYLPQSRDSMIFFGFGPMFRYSKFDVGLRDTTTGNVKDYSLQDMTLGAAFNGGYAFRINSISLRLEAKYHWEKRSYFGFGGALQFLF